MFAATLGLLLVAGVACGSDDTPENGDASSATPRPTVQGTLTNADGWPRVEGIRGKRYCEVLLPRIVDARLNAEVWNSFGLNECPDAEWKALDAAAIKEERGTILALLNGPRYWLMDAIEKKPSGQPRQETKFGEIEMFLAATVDLGPIPPSLGPYVEHRVDRQTVFEFVKGSEVYELSAPGDRVYIMQTYSQQNDPALDEAALPAIGARLKLPAGWTYAARTLDATFRLTVPDGKAAVIQDDLGNSYSLIESN